MKPGMTRWKELPLKCSGLPSLPTPFSPVQRQRKFSAVRGQVLANSVISTLPAGSPSRLMSKKTLGSDSSAACARLSLGPLAPPPPPMMPRKSMKASRVPTPMTTMVVGSLRSMGAAGKRRRRSRKFDTP
eukprot:scaffold41525_cov73-Phaeocystis_antarctica.AAC.2